MREADNLKLGSNDKGLVDENAPSMIYLKSPSMVPRGVTFLSTLEDWDDQLSLQVGHPANIDYPGTPNADASAIPRMLEVNPAVERNSDWNEFKRYFYKIFSNSFEKKIEFKFIRIL